MEDFCDGVHHTKRRYVLVDDYAQHVGIPHFSGEQPGYTYYFSPLTIFLFGLVDPSKEKTTIQGYSYLESTGKKGSENVTSMIMHNLREKYWLRDEPGARLILVFDNCAGQKKNNNFLRLALYLVEARFFLEVEIIFYIRGHTKNSCDRMYNEMKTRFHKIQVMTHGKALTLLSSSPNVHMLDAKKADFKSYGHLLNLLYKKFPRGKIFKNHIFVSSEIDGNLLMKISTHNGVPMDTLDMVRHDYVPDADRDL
jgi:hypothetical protein